MAGSGLDDLLSGVAGFSRPRTLAGLKQQSQAPQATPVQASSAAAPPARNRSPSLTPGGDLPGLDQLEHIAKSRSNPALAPQR